MEVRTPHEAKTLLQEAARQARREQTSAEQKLWEMLRAHRCGGLHFRRQCIRRPFRLDFYCASVKLAIEVDGSVHDVPDVHRRDQARQEVLEQAMDIHFLRVTNEDVLRRPHDTRQRIFKTAKGLANLTSPFPKGEVASLSEPEGADEGDKG